MKAVICANGGIGVHIHTPGTGIWQVCQCGCTGARWEDPEAGRLIVACRGDRGRVFGLGLNNQLLLPAITASGQMWQDYRRWHDAATDAPGYVFDKAKAGCWAVVFRIGSTSDTRWATDPEQEECFAPFQSGEQVSVPDDLIRDVLEALCCRDGLSLDSAAEPGEPARNYELADRLGIGHVFGLREPQ